MLYGQVFRIWEWTQTNFMKTPPHIARWILSVTNRKRNREIILGDFEEVYNEMLVSHGWFYAELWFYVQAVKSAPFFLFTSIYWGVVMFKSYLRIGYRNLLKNKTYSSINILGFALSLAAFILIALYVQYEFSFDIYHENADNIYRVVRNKPGGTGTAVTKTAVTPAPLAPLLVDAYPEILKATRIIQSKNAIVKVDNNSFSEDNVYWAEPETFEIFTIPFVQSKPLNVMKEPHSIVLSEKRALKYFGEINPVGKTLTLSIRNHELDFEVAGIIKNMPGNSHLKMDVILPLNTYFSSIIKREITSWRGNFIYTYLLLQKGTNSRALIAKFPGMLDKHVYEKYNIEIEDKYKEVVTLQALTDIHLHSNRNAELEANGDYEGVLLLSSLAVLFLIIACINYMNLSTAKASQRSKEVGLRKIVGAQRRQLIYQFFGESILTTFIAFIISIAIVILVLPSFSLFVERNLEINLYNNPQLFISLAALVLFIGLYAGSSPALFISNLNPLSVLRGSFIRSKKGSRLRSILVIVQFAITIIFITFTFVVKDQLDYIRDKDAGYTKDHIITLNVPDKNIAEHIETIKSELVKHPGIIMVSNSYKLPNNIDEHRGIYRPGKEPFMIYYNSADYNYSDLYDIEIIKGRNFSRKYPADLKGAFLVNEAAVKAAQWEDPIGEELTHFTGKTGKIVGVMKDFHIRSFHYAIEPVYIILDPGSTNYLSIKIGSENIAGTIKYVENVMKRIAPTVPFNYKFFDEIYNSVYQNEKKLGLIFSAFAMMAIIVACLGLFGLATFAAENRTREVGIRKTLGSSSSEIFILLSKEFLTWVLLGNIVAWPFAYYFIRNWLNSFTYRVELNLLFFMFAGMLSLIIAIITVSYQAAKAARVNPVDSLKYE